MQTFYVVITAPFIIGFMAHMLLVLIQSLSKIFRCNDPILWEEADSDELFI